MKVKGNKTQKRMLLLLSLYATLFVLLIVRLSYLQVWGGDALQERAVRQWTRDSTVTAKRGRILDRAGTTLAQSATSYYVTVVPKQVADDNKDADPEEKRRAAATMLSEKLGLEFEAVLAKVKDTSRAEHVVARQLDRTVVDAVRAAKVTGVYIGEDAKRVYPMGAFLTQVLGFCTVSNNGQDGLEAALEKYLAGTNGRIVREADAKNRTVPYSSESFVPPHNGNDVVLTIDYVIQSFAEKAAREALENNLAQKVEVIVSDVRTGEILAMLNVPDFDLNEPPRSNLEELMRLTRNSCVADSYEPGSTFKILTTAAALEEKVVSPDSTFNCIGYTMVDGDKIRCWRTGNPHGHQTLTEAVENSCNPVFVDLSLRMGRERFYSYLSDFGIGRQTGVDLPAEAAGQMISLKYVKDVDLARVGFGQSVAVTPLQMVMACSAAVTGNVMKPYIVKELRDENGETIKKFEPEVLGTPISQSTAQYMRDILESVVEKGGGKNAYIPGYRVGGKTGTAQKFQNGKLLRDVHVSSFIGFAPMDDPRICVIVVVDEPGIRPDYGSTVAAPYARRIMEDTLRHLDIQPQYKDGGAAASAQPVIMPDVVGKSADTARRILEGNGLTAVIDGAVGEVQQQMPAAGQRIPAGSLVTLYLDGAYEQAEDGLVIVPDVTGMSVMEANREMRRCGLQMRIDGGGLAYGQSPIAGSSIPVGTTVKVMFKEP